MAISYKFLQECNIKTQLRPKRFSKTLNIVQSIKLSNDFHLRKEFREFKGLRGSNHVSLTSAFQQAF